MPYWQKYSRYDWQQSKTEYTLHDKNTAPTLAKSTRAVFSVYSRFKSLFSHFIPLPLYFYPCTISSRICPSARPTTRHLKLFLPCAHSFSWLSSHTSSATAFKASMKLSSDSSSGWLSLILLSTFTTSGRNLKSIRRIHKIQTFKFYLSLLLPIPRSARKPGMPALSGATLATSLFRRARNLFPI